MKANLARSVLLAAVLAGMLSAGVAWTVTAQEPEAAPRPSQNQTGVSGCIGCHEHPERTGSLSFQRFESDKLILMKESTIWDQEDPHRVAFKALQDNPKLIQRMQEKLKNTIRGDILKSNECLSCHGSGDQEYRNGVHGVACAACHGLNEAWQSDHYKETRDNQNLLWRTLDAKDKDKRGFVNLRDCKEKAGKCVSCHVGNVREGKVITHDMYAAGHPPLPPFELMSFLHDQPKHWRLPEEITYPKAMTPELLQTNYSVIAGDHTPSRNMLMGALVSLQAELELLDHSAGIESAKTIGLDYARFDCYSCHHDLKYPSVRQMRGYEARDPGRPPLKAWTMALARITAEFLGSTKEFDEAWAALQAAATARPFGDASRIKTLLADTKSMKAWCSKAIEAIQKLPAIAKTDRKLAGLLKATLQDEKTLQDSEVTMVLLWALHAVEPLSEGQLKELKEKKLLPAKPRDCERSVDGKTPTTAGFAAGPRLNLFNAFDTEDKIREFKALFGPNGKK